jgi:hypothetical protein
METISLVEGSQVGSVEPVQGSSVEGSEGPPVEWSRVKISPVQWSPLGWYAADGSPVEGNPPVDASTLVDPSPPVKISPPVETSQPEVEIPPPAEVSPLVKSSLPVEGSPPVEGSTGTVMSIIIVDHDGIQRKRRISSDIGFQSTLTSLHVNWLVDKDSYEIADFGSLKDGETYIFPAFWHQKQQERELRCCSRIPVGNVFADLIDLTISFIVIMYS